MPRRAALEYITRLRVALLPRPSPRDGQALLRRRGPDRRGAGVRLAGQDLLLRQSRADEWLKNLSHPRSSLPAGPTRPRSGAHG